MNTPLSQIATDLTYILRAHGYTDFVVPDFGSFDETTHEALTDFKAEIQGNFNSTLTAFQKPYRSIDKLNTQIVQLRPTAKTNVATAEKNEKRTENLLREVEVLQATANANFHAFFAQRLTEEAFRGVPEAYKTGDWYWVEVNIERTLAIMSHIRRDGGGNYTHSVTGL